MRRYRLRNLREFEPLEQESRLRRFLNEPAAFAGAALQHVVMRAGARVPLHRHEHAEMLVLTLRGQGRATLEEDVVTLWPGDVLHLPRGVGHALETVGREDWEYLVLQHPEVYGRDGQEHDVVPMERP